MLSTSALTLHIGAIDIRSSADNELLGLPGRTSACVPTEGEGGWRFFMTFQNFFIQQIYSLDPEALGRLSTELAEHWNA